MSQEQPNTTMTPVPDVTLVSDSKDKEIVDLEAVTRVVKAKLDQDLAEAQVRNEGIVRRKQEWTHCQAAAKKKKEDEEAAEAQQKADEATKKKGSEQPLVSFACLLQQSGN